MKFKPAVWYPIAAVLSGLNVVFVWFAAQPAEPWHATSHAALAVAFGVWAERLRQRTRGGDFQDGLEAVQIEVGNLRQELGETQERLDFTERMLAQERESRRVGPQD
jgi:hypothetical protein